MLFKKWMNRIHRMNPVQRRPKMPWIPVEIMLPPEPAPGVEDAEGLDEYIVTIEGAALSTALNYAGDGIWCEGDNLYTVIAWIPFPEVYQP